MSQLASDYFARHRDLLERAAHACRTREYFSPFPETPDKYPDSQNAMAAGRAVFEAQLGQRFDLEQPGIRGSLGNQPGGEVSPYTGKALGIEYPRSDVDVLFNSARAALPKWAALEPRARIGVCLEIIDRWYRHLFEIVPSVMHTAGQSFPMSYAGSGANALDRGIEAVVYAHWAMEAVAPDAIWERRFGSAQIRLQKRYRLVPRGVAVCFTCATFPTWNAFPAMMASLATGNAVIVKPHPTGVLPMAISVRLAREVIAEAGLDPNLVTLAVDSVAEPLGKVLIKHPDAAIIDFTGSARFGAWVEANAHPALCYTETSGVNTVVLDSMPDLDAAVRSIGTTMSMFSAQMCTSPQNIYVPRQGIRAGGRTVSVDEFAAALVGMFDSIAGEPKRAASILAALQSPSTLDLITEIERAGRDKGEVLRTSAAYAHPEFPDARTRSPLLVRLDARERELAREERFGPIGFLVTCDGRDDALAQATADVRAAGGITAFVYSEDERFLDSAEQAYSQAGAQLTCNLTGAMPLNFAASYSDYHVTGLNPAGNATLTDASFVASRFRITQSRRPAS